MRFRHANVSAIARFLKPFVNLNGRASQEAIVMALRRYSRKLPKEDAFSIAKELSRCTFSIRTGESGLCVRRSSDSKESILFSGKKSDWHAERVLVFFSPKSILLAGPPSVMASFKKRFPKRDILRESKNLAIVTVWYPEELEASSVLIPYLTIFLHANGIRIKSVNTAMVSASFIVHGEDATLAHTKLQNLLLLMRSLQEKNAGTKK